MFDNGNAELLEQFYKLLLSNFISNSGFFSAPLFPLFMK